MSIFYFFYFSLENKVEKWTQANTRFGVFYFSLENKVEKWTQANTGFWVRKGLTGKLFRFFFVFSTKQGSFQSPPTPLQKKHAKD